MDQILLYSNILMWVVQVFVLFALFMIFRQFGTVYLKSSDAISRDGLPIGDVIPDFKTVISYKTGKSVNKNQMLTKPTLLTFISPNCPACKDLIPDWNKAALKYKDKVNFVIVCIGKEKEQFDKFLKNRRIESEILLDLNQEMFELLKVRVAPFAFMLDQEGVVKEKGLCNSEKSILGLMSSVNNTHANVPSLTKI